MNMEESAVTETPKVKVKLDRWQKADRRAEKRERERVRQGDEVIAIEQERNIIERERFARIDRERAEDAEYRMHVLAVTRQNTAALEHLAAAIEKLATEEKR